MSTCMEARPLKPPAGSVRLIESNKGPLMAIAAREGFEDAVLGFELISVDAEDRPLANTTWPIKLSFPVFCRMCCNILAATGKAQPRRAYGPGSR